MAALTPVQDLPEPGSLDSAWAGQALELVSGDVPLVAPFPNGVLVALIDGLGHGQEAATAAETAMQVLRDHAGAPLPRLVEHCHEALRKTRGAVLSLASFDLVVSTMTWAGIGNVEGVLLRARPGERGDLADATLLLRGGIVGSRLPSLRVETLGVGGGDLLVMTTDGIRSGYADGIDREAAPAAIASAILANHARAEDDACVLVARLRGGA
jgi:negative regulator of sigma-B (phosphoserine phosphatase)